MKPKSITIEGIDIKDVETTRLIRDYKLYTILIPFYFLFAVFFATVAIAFLIDMPVEDMWIIPIIGIAGAATFFTVGIKLTIKIIYMRKEINLREITVAEQENAKKSFMTFIIVSVAIIVIVPTIILSSLGINPLEDLFDEPVKNGYCIICDKKATNKFQGSDYCKTHYDKAVKWAIDSSD